MELRQGTFFVFNKELVKNRLVFCNTTLLFYFGEWLSAGTPLTADDSSIVKDAVASFLARSLATSYIQCF
ncbi:hypothetical protein AB205_0075990 [Aquarana catesbeiana]|uniref:Uncharacterized protein n=1 Tax=Aquarana catesbeiana TaxID=8400 RepID=A0A2G9S720_AQUCT|nr:hypothetical protein AB205_0075990 [Aquarana catesbeiana]